MTVSHNENKIKERNRHIYRLICDGILLLLAACIFYYVWTRLYNPHFRVPYRFKGNYFVTFIYVILLMVCSRLYGGLKLGYYKTFNIVFGLSVTALLTNMIAYIAVIIPAATWYLTPVPAVIYMTALDILLALVWGMVTNNLFHKIFPPQELLLISEIGTDEFAAKFALRNDRYHIAKSIVVNQGGDGTKQSGYVYSHREATEDISVYFPECHSYDGIVIGDIPSGQRNDLLKYCYAHGIRTYTIPKITDVILKNSEAMHIFDSPIFLSRNRGLSMEQEMVKRISDIIMSATGLILLSPVFLIVAAAIKIEDHGPVFFRQERCTKDGRVFEILKFRSMIENAEQSGIAIPATEKDPRITKVGHVIRAARIDELPQLFNILKGDMSVVGPRPERVEHVRQYIEEVPEFAYRMKVKGGLTGYAQVYGKYNTSAYDKLKLDLMYIENYSIILDIEIILRTFQVLFTKESTEGFDKERSLQITGKAQEILDKPQEIPERASSDRSI